MKYKKIAFIVLILAFVLQAAACETNSNKIQKTEPISLGSQEENTGSTSDTADVKSQTAQESGESTDKSSSEDNSKDNSKDTLKPADTREISIYTLSESTEDVEVIPALIPKDQEVTPQFIVDLVTESLGDRLINVGIDKVSTEGDKVIVSFLSGQPPVTNVGSGVEGTILNAYAQSLVDNLKDYKKVIFRVEGKAYTSGHYAYGLNEVYLDASASK